ncbi:MAG: hydroxyacid dehydrogenase [Chloroflexi bacterium]|nr:hydroxyacid dehydrogenase [Chloroflexota bacterium]
MVDTTDDRTTPTSSARPRVLLCANSTVREQYWRGEALERLERIADWEWLPSEGVCTRPGVWGGPSEDPADVERLRQKIGDVDILVVCHGAPYIDDSILGAAPRLRLIGELEGDRFANRIAVEAAAARGVRAVDSTNGSSLPVAEWALALMIVGLRNAAEHYRRLIGGEEYRRSHDDYGFRHGELTGQTVGLIGLGHIGRRLIELLEPFHCRILVHDPYVPKELALAVGVQLTSLDRVMADPDVVVCAAPLTPKTRGMIGARELNLLKHEAVFVNVSRGAIVDSAALIERAKRGDIRVSLDVFDPEPIPAESEIRTLSNVFLSPHIAGVTAACRPRFFSLMVDEIERFLAGHETMFDLSPRVLANRRGSAPTTA